MQTNFSSVDGLGYMMIMAMREAWRHVYVLKLRIKWGGGGEQGGRGIWKMKQPT
jgi:hypothetical protein